MRKASKHIKSKCKNCSSLFERDLYPSSIRSGHRAVFCGQACMISFMKKNAFSFICRVCSKSVFTSRSQMLARNRETCSRVCRYKLLRLRILEKRKTYTKHQLDRLARYSVEAVNWRLAVFKRDNYTCQACGVRGTYLEADHIKPFAYFPELRYELSNGRTLCRKCHNKTKMNYRKMREIWQRK